MEARMLMVVMVLALLAAGCSAEEPGPEIFSVSRPDFSGAQGEPWASADGGLVSEPREGCASGVPRVALVDPAEADTDLGSVPFSTGCPRDRRSADVLRTGAIEAWGELVAAGTISASELAILVASPVYARRESSVPCGDVISVSGERAGAREIVERIGADLPAELRCIEVDHA